MRIGILTYPFNANFGGLLQNYALQTFLINHGHDVYTICQEKIYNEKSLHVCLAILYRSVKKYVLGKKDVIVQLEKTLNRENITIGRNTSQFEKKWINTYVVTDIRKDIECDKFDMFVVGSDQIWNPNMINLYTYYLDFTKNSKVYKISYAASFGKESVAYNYYKRRKCEKLLRKFDGVSVREKTGVDICKRMFGIEAQWVLDPTFLLNKDDYNYLLEDSQITHIGGLVVYILDPSEYKNKQISEISQALSCEPYKINADVQNRNLSIEERVQPSVESWLLSIKTADYVVTDSFHGMVFSIIFEKQFVVLANYNRGMARFESLLNYLGLSERLIKSNQKIEETIISAPIDYRVVNKALEDFRSKSVSYLSQYI